MVANFLARPVYCMCGANNSWNSNVGQG